MKAFFVTTFVLLLLLSVLVSNSIQREDDALMVSIRESGIVLGGKMPQNSVCNWMDSNDVIWCSLPTDRNVNFGLSRHSFRVVSVTYFIWYEGVTVGDLVLRWGRPVGTRRLSYGTYIYFTQHRSVFIVASAFRPTTRVGFVSLDLQGGPECDWTGFENQKLGC